MIIRPESHADYAAVEAINDAAFGGENEAYLIRLIRQSDMYVPELSLIAVLDDGTVAGHVMFSRVLLDTPDGEEQIFDLAPLAVLPDHQGVGIGAALTMHGLELLEARAEPLVLVEGIPSYYPRFGFERASLHGITPPSPRIPDEAFMVKLLGNYEPRFRGAVRFPEAFDLAETLGP